MQKNVLSKYKVFTEFFKDQNPGVIFYLGLDFYITLQCISINYGQDLHVELQNLFTVNI
jgi:hypothetical protein